MFPRAAPTGPTRPVLPSASPVQNWSVALYRKAEIIQLTDPTNSTVIQQTYGSFYIQLQHQATSTSPSSTDVLYFRYQNSQQKNSVESYQLPFTVTQINEMKLSVDVAPLATTTRMNPLDSQQAFNEPIDHPPTLLLRAKAFLGVLVLNTTGVIRPFLIFVTEETFVGQLFDAYIFRISQVATISMRDNPEDEAFVAGIKKLFQARSFYYATHCNAERTGTARYFAKPYDLTLCAQRMVQGHDSDLRFFWNRGLCLPLLKFHIDIRYWIPKVMCGGIETYRSPNEDLELWLISRLSCERAGTRFNVRGVNDDGAVANFVETEQIVFSPRQMTFSSFVIVRGSIPLFWHQPRFQVGAHRITISRSEALSFKAFFEHFKHLYRHYGRVLILNLVDKRDDEQRVGEEFEKLFNLLVKTFQSKQKKERPGLGYLSERDFLWFDYHDQSKLTKNLTPEQFVDRKLIKNPQFSLEQELERQSVFTWANQQISSQQKGILRINCIDCLDRTNNVQLAIGLLVLTMQIESLRKPVQINNLVERLRDMWINNGDHISRIYTGTGALGQRNKAKDIQRSVGRAIQNSLRDDEKQQSIQTLIYSYSKDSYLHERSVAALLTPYVISDGSILTELFFQRQRFVRKEKFRISIGTWNINGDKNPALEDQYPSILDAWILDGPENLGKTRKDNSIPTIGFVNDDYVKAMPDILAIGFQEICDLTATNMVWQCSVNATRWVENVQSHFKRAYPNDEYILLGNDQLVGVCLAIFVRRDLAPYVKNVVVDSVKTGMGGKIGNKGCVAIRLVLHSTSICFICAHFTAGQKEFTERNKDFKSIMEKLSFQPPSRALWHDHIFFLGDFNYRLTIPRNQVEYLAKNQAYQQLLEYDQLKKEHNEGNVFQEFLEGPIVFPPTYKYDVGSDEYDTSEKARTPSYTDRVLWRSILPNLQSQLLYYGRAEVKTSDHRPVSAMFDVDVEILDETKMHQNYVEINERFRPTNGQIVFQLKTETNLRRNQLIDEFESYLRKTYGRDLNIFDRFFLPNQKPLALIVAFENGEIAKKVLQPVEDQLPNGISFVKRLVDSNEELSQLQKLNLLFANADETMYPESISYDLGNYQQPSRESLSTNQDVTVAGIVADENDDENEKIKLARQAFEQRRRDFGDIFETKIEENLDDNENENENENDDENEENDNESLASRESDAPTSTDSDSPYGSDSSSSSSYDEYYANRQLPKKKLHPSHDGPIKLYFQETIGDWPMYRYKKYRERSMKRQGIDINYGNVHTKEIKHSLKQEKLERRKDQEKATTLTEMMGQLTKNASFLFLDVQKPVVKSNESSPPSRRSSFSEQTKSTMTKMKDSFRRSFKRNRKPNDNSNTETDVDEQNNVSFSLR